LKDHLHDENSIGEVADACLPLVLRFGALHGKHNNEPTSPSKASKPSVLSKRIILGGWSFGGVVASVVAEKLASGHSGDSSGLVVVQGLVLFDAPLRLQVTDEEESGRNSSDPHTDRNDKVAAHFAYCTKLLRKHYVRPVVEAPLVMCNVLDIRAELSTYDGGVNAVREVTRGDIRRHVTPGDHFTMLFGHNASGVAKLVGEFVQQMNC
jgi:pimeloyl-ACP methyl ester carboxylesterase